MKKLILVISIMLSVLPDLSAQSVKIPNLPTLVGTNVDSSWFVISIPGGGNRKVRGHLLTNGIDSITEHSSQWVDTTKYWRKGSVVHISTAFKTDGIVAGGLITRLDSTTYRVSATSYRILSVLYNAPQVDLTLSPNNDTLPRKDVFFANTSGTISVKQGDYAFNPQPPYLIPGQEIGIGIVDFPAGNDTGRLGMYNIVVTGIGIDSNAYHTITVLSPTQFILCKPSGACDTINSSISNFATEDLVATGNRNHDFNDSYLNIFNLKALSFLTKTGTNGSYSFIEKDTTLINMESYNGATNKVARLRVNGSGARLTYSNLSANTSFGFIAEGDSTSLHWEDATKNYRWINSPAGVQYQRATKVGVEERAFIIPTWGTGKDTAASKADVRAAGTSSLPYKEWVAIVEFQADTAQPIVTVIYSTVDSTLRVFNDAGSGIFKVETLLGNSFLTPYKWAITIQPSFFDNDNMFTYHLREDASYTSTTCSFSPVKHTNTTPPEVSLPTNGVRTVIHLRIYP